MREVRLKDIVQINRRTLPETTSPERRFRYIDIGAVTQGVVAIPDDEVTFGSAPSRARRLAEPGDTIVSTVRTYLRAVAPVPHTDDPLVFSTGFAVLHPCAQAEPRFLSYYCQSKAFIEEVVARSVGVSYPAINASELGDFRLRLPRLEEQRRIADFLDAETARVGRLIGLRRQQVERADDQVLARARHGLIEEDQPLVAGVPLRYLLRHVQTGGTPAADEQDCWAAEGDEDAVPWYAPGAFSRGLTLGSAEKYVGLDALSRRVVPRFRAGSVLLIGIGATAGRVAYLDAMATGNQQITALTPNRRIGGRYLAWSLWARTDMLREVAPYTTLPIMNNDFIKSVRVPLPDMPSQERLVAELDAADGERRHLTLLAERFDRRMTERHEALITAAVTGQLDVATARGAA